MALRSIWNGTIGFAGVFVPIKVHSAVEDRTVHFHEVHVDDEARIEHRRICPKEDREVPYEEIVKGYEVAEGKFVVLTDDEIKAAAGAGSRLIEISEFVCAGEIDPVLYDRTYFLGSQDAGKDAYRLLHDALERSDRAGIGRWVFHDREYLVAIRAYDGALAMHTMRFHDELVAAGDLDIGTPSKNPSRRELAMAEELLASLRADFDPGDHEDTYRERLLEYIAAKAKGRLDELPRTSGGGEESGDLLAALQASMSARS